MLASILIGIVYGDQPCLGAPTDRPSFVPSPESCDAYILCWNGQTFRGERCPAGLLFDAVHQMCSSSTCTNCSPFGIQNLPHPQFCSRFIECRMGLTTFRDCPNGSMFDRRSGNCVLAEYVDCVDDPSVTTISTTPTTPPSNELPSCPSDGIFHAHPTSCSHFFICVNFDLWLQECPMGQHWNRNKEECDTPWAAQCPNVVEVK